MGPARDHFSVAPGQLRRALPRAGAPARPAALDRSLQHLPLRRNGLRRPGRRADGRVLVVGQVRRRLQLHRNGLGGPRLRQADHRRRSLYRQRRREMAGPSGQHQGPGRLGLLRRHQPLRLPSLCHAAVAGPQARHVDGPLGAPLRADRNLVGAVEGLARVSRPLPVLAPAGALCCRHLFCSVRKVRRKPSTDNRVLSPRRPARRASPWSGPATTSTPARRRSC